MYICDTYALYYGGACLARLGLTSSAILALSVAMEEVMSLRQVRFDHNPIGDAGAQVLMQIPVATRGRVKISTNKCTCFL